MADGHTRAGWIERTFRAHPRSLGEGYWAHGRAAARIGGQLVVAGLACFVHALVPALCTTRASRTIQRLHAKVTARTGRPPTADNWLNYEI